MDTLLPASIIRGRWPGLDTLIESLGRSAERLIANLPNIVLGILVYAAATVVARAVRNLIARAGHRATIDPIVFRPLTKLAGAIVLLVGFLVATSIVFPDSFNLGQVVAGLGVTSVAIGFAMKDLLQSFFAGILLLWQQPFRSGDEIRTKDYEGMVEEIRFRSTSLITYDGERAILPNTDVYTGAALVRTAFERRRVRLAITVGQTDESQRNAIQASIAAVEGVLQDPPASAHLVAIAGANLTYHAYFWVEARQAAVIAVTDRVTAALRTAVPQLQEAKSV
jgi:small conductance mechanosensitive channel